MRTSDPRAEGNVPPDSSDEPAVPVSRMQTVGHGSTPTAESSTRSAEAALSALTQQLAGFEDVVHDLNNALSVVFVYLHELAARTERNPTQQLLVSRARTALQHAGALAQALAQPQARSGTARAKVDARSVLVTLEPLLRALLGPDVAFDMKVGSEPCVVEVDVLQLERAIANLVSNAAHAVDGAGRVEVHVRGAQGRVCIDVSDSGPGIPEELRDKVLERGFTTRSKLGGRGLGLASAHATARQLGGDLAIRSRRGGGTIVTIELPLST